MAIYYYYIYWPCSTEVATGLQPVTKTGFVSLSIQYHQSTSMYLNHFSMIHFCLSNCIFPTTSSPNPCHTTWSSKHKFSTVDRHQGLQRQIMLKQFASLKNCRCTWQLIWQIYVYEADTIEINRNINMVLRFWKYTDMI